MKSECQTRNLAWTSNVMGVGWHATKTQKSPSKVVGIPRATFFHTLKSFLSVSVTSEWDIGTTSPESSDSSSSARTCYPGQKHLTVSPPLSESDVPLPSGSQLESSPTSLFLRHWNGLLDMLNAFLNLIVLHLIDSLPVCYFRTHPSPLNLEKNAIWITTLLWLHDSLKW